MSVTRRAKYFDRSGILIFPAITCIFLWSLSLLASSVGADLRLGRRQRQRQRQQQQQQQEGQAKQQPQQQQFSCDHYQPETNRNHTSCH